MSISLRPDRQLTQISDRDHIGLTKTVWTVHHCWRKDRRPLEQVAQLKVNPPHFKTRSSKMKRSREAEEDSDPPSSYSDAILESGTHTDPGAPAAKIVELDPSSSGPSERGSGIEMRCSLPGHQQGLVFKTYDDFDTHYSKDHSHRCLECRKNFPSGHLLTLHHEESHDPILAVKRERGEHTVSRSSL